MTRPDSTPTLATIHCPVQILVGDEDAITPPPLSEQMHSDIAGSELAIIKGAGHMSNMEQPRAVQRRARAIPRASGIVADTAMFRVGRSSHWFSCLRRSPSRRSAQESSSTPKQSALDQLLDLYVRDGFVYYRALKADRAKLDGYVSQAAAENIAAFLARTNRSRSG